MEDQPISFDIEKRSLDSVGNDAYSEIRAVRKQLQLKELCLSMALKALEDNEDYETLERITKVALTY